MQIVLTTQTPASRLYPLTQVLQFLSPEPEHDWQLWSHLGDRGGEREREGEKGRGREERESKRERVRERRREGGERETVRV